MRYLISLSYNGSSYFGWQKQPNELSVQESVERALSVYLREEIKITGAGRTDTGVHAINYVAHFDSGQIELEKDYHMLLYKINAILPHDIVINDICITSPESHARFDAVSRTYKYYINTKKDPFCNQQSFYFPYKIDLIKLNSACAYLLGEQDFTSLAKLHGSAKTNICNVTKAEWEELSPGHFCFTVTANRFLRNMVRAMVGSLLEVAKGRQEPQWIKSMLEERERGAAGNSVPAHALFLCEITYPYETFKK